MFDSLFPDNSVNPPSVDATQYLVNGEILKWPGECVDVVSPIRRRGAAGGSDRIVIGRMAMLSEKEGLRALDAAVAAYASGSGQWPAMHPSERIAAMRKFSKRMAALKPTLVEAMMWENCKNRGDCEKEIDRTVEYIHDTIREFTKMENDQTAVVSIGGIVSQIRRDALGVVLAVSVQNYILNETGCLLFPALMMGNTVVMKTQTVGCLVNTLLLPALRECFPPGAVNIIHGAGRTLLGPIMATGRVDILAFIGTSGAAKTLQAQHPTPLRLRLALGLDAKNPAFVLHDADLALAVSECVLGATSFNGQRCTALKMLFVHESIVDEFARRVAKEVDALGMGMPWENAKITPLFEASKPEKLAHWLDDAVKKGAKVVNARGGQRDRSFFAPTVIVGVTPEMEIWNEEQFGPLIPIVPFKDVSTCWDYVTKSRFGQQASLFSANAATIPEYIDILVHHVARVNLNSQCQRGPDFFPFTGRRDSAVGTLSVYDALRTMSIRVMVAAKETEHNAELLSGVMQGRKSKFLRSDIVFNPI